jgi:hypothetical protein
MNRKNDETTQITYCHIDFTEFTGIDGASIVVGTGKFSAGHRGNYSHVICHTLDSSHRNN